MSWQVVSSTGRTSERAMSIGTVSSVIPKRAPARLRNSPTRSNELLRVYFFRLRHPGENTLFDLRRPWQATAPSPDVHLHASSLNLRSVHPRPRVHTVRQCDGRRRDFATLRTIFRTTAIAGSQTRQPTCSRCLWRQSALRTESIPPPHAP